MIARGRGVILFTGAAAHLKAGARSGSFGPAKLAVRGPGAITRSRSRVAVCVIASPLSDFMTVTTFRIDDGPTRAV